VRPVLPGLPSSPVFNLLSQESFVSLLAMFWLGVMAPGRCLWRSRSLSSPLPRRLETGLDPAVPGHKRAGCFKSAGQTRRCPRLLSSCIAEPDGPAPLRLVGFENRLQKGGRVV
jgi:hypothetical protein